MDDIGSRNDFLRLRDAWFNSIVGLVNEMSHPLDVDPFALALVRLSIGGGHMLGYRDRDLVLPITDVDWVTREVARWRNGDIHPRIARSWVETWTSLYLYARDNSRVSPELLAAFLSHPVGRYAAQATAKDLSVTARSPDSLQYVLQSGHQLPLGAPQREGFENPLDIAPNHLALSAHLIAENSARAIEILSPLELLASAPDDEMERRCDEWLLAARRIRQVWLTVPGSWSGSAPHGVPSHIADYVLNRAGRQGHSTTGVISGWFATAESLGVLKEFRRLAYGVAIGLDVQPDLLCVKVHPPAGDGTSASAWSARYYYTRDGEDLRILGVTAATRTVLFDLMYLDRSNQLRHDSTFRIELEDKVVSAIVDFIGNSTPLDPVTPNLPPAPDVEGELRAEAAEGRRFEVARLVRRRVEGRLEADEAGALEGYLDALNRYAALASLSEDHPAAIEVDDARTALRDLVNDRRLLKTTVGPDLLECLGTGRAFLHIELSEYGFLTPVASWLDSDGTPRHRHFDCGHLSPSRPKTGDDWIQMVATLLAPVAALAEEGIRNLVVSPHTDGYELPYHEALLKHGFETVSYAPSLTLLQPVQMTAPPSHSMVIVGSPGAGAGRLDGVEAELSYVADLYGFGVAEMLPIRGAYQLMHLAGHAESGLSEAQSILHLGVAGDLSGIAVLRDMRLVGTQLVVLSACATGHMVYGPRQLLEHAPFDACFLAVGVRSVVYTSRPIADQIAFLFATAFHASLFEGQSLWEAYAAGRAAARKPSRSAAPAWSLARLDAAWPGWDSWVVPREARDDWLSFRLGGRHWT